MAADAMAEVSSTLGTLASFGQFAPAAVDGIASRVTMVGEAHAGRALAEAEVIFEGVPEVLDLKREVLARASPLPGPTPSSPRPRRPSWSTTSRAPSKSRALPQRPLAQPRLSHTAGGVVAGREDDPPSRRGSRDAGGHRQGAGGVRGAAGLYRAAHPGAGHERGGAHGRGGCRLAEDIDKAIKYGFGFRYAVLGMLEFIDYGGGDILYYASRYLTEALGDDALRRAGIIERNMREGNIGLKTGKGSSTTGISTSRPTAASA